MEHEIPELDAKGLRRFGLTTGALVAGLFGVALPWLFDFAWPLWPWAVAGVLIAWALLAPGTLGPVYRGWMRFGLLLNRVTTPLVMGVVFFLLIAPVALLMRLARRDPLARRFEPEVESYRVKSEVPEKGSLERPF